MNSSNIDNIDSPWMFNKNPLPTLIPCCALPNIDFQDERVYDKDVVGEITYYSKKETFQFGQHVEFKINTNGDWPQEDNTIQLVLPVVKITEPPN
jgi:hypothetical protein